METTTEGNGVQVAEPAISDGGAKVASALAAAQGAFPDIERSRTVKVTLKSGVSYTFDYAPLDAILRACRPALAANGLALNHSIDTTRDNCITVTTWLRHESGEVISVPLTFPYGYSEVQQLGSLITYLKRYGTEAILGVCAEQDDDGNVASGNGREMSDRTPKAQTPPNTSAKSAPARTSGASVSRSSEQTTDSKITPADAEKIRKAIDELLPESAEGDDRKAMFFDYIEWAGGARVDRLGSLTALQGSTVLAKAQNGETPPPGWTAKGAA